VSGESERRRPPIAGSGVAGVPIARDARRLGVLPSARERMETEDIRWGAMGAGCSSRFEGRCEFLCLGGVVLLLW
jgi:hypothetical protein